MRRKWRGFFGLLLIAALLAGCGEAESSAPVAEPEKAESVAQTEEPVTGAVAEETEAPQEEVKKPAEEVTVTITDKINRPEDFAAGRYSDTVTFLIEATNNTDRDIQGVQGILTINDLFGKQIMKITCDLTGQIIPAGATVTYEDVGMQVNEFDESDVKVYNEDYADLEFLYAVKSIVYADESTEETSKTQGSEEVAVRCVGKQNYPADYTAGQALPYVQFKFEIENLTDRAIRGVQGVLTVSDLFGQEIKRINCDFTGQTISPGETATDDKYLEVNEFINSDVKVWNQEYADMQFSYKISDVVYAD